ARSREDAARDRLAQRDVVGLPRTLNRREPGHQRHVCVLGAIKNVLRGAAAAWLVAAVRAEVPAEVSVDVNHPRHHREASELVRGRAAGGRLDGSDLGSLHDDRGVVQHLAGAIQKRGGMNPNRLVLRCYPDRETDGCGGEEGFWSHQVSLVRRWGIIILSLKGAGRDWNVD